MKLLKICNVKNIYEARTLGEGRVDFVGLHLISAQDYANADNLKTIIRLFHQEYPGTKTLLVTKEKEIAKLIALVNEFECDGLQLHFPAPAETFAILRAHFGNRILLVGVVGAHDTAAGAYDRTDYLIIDQNFIGGTGQKIEASLLQRLLQKYQHHKILIAGGVDAAFIADTKDHVTFCGYDVQSGVRSDHRTEFENIDYHKARQIMAQIGHQPASPSAMQVGISLDPQDSPAKFFGACDFWHFDFFDNIFGHDSDIDELVQIARTHAQRNSHFQFQFHIFTARKEYVQQLLQQLETFPLKASEYYVHLGPETLREYAGTYASLDVKAVITGRFPLTASLSRERILLCMQSEKHIERGMNANIAINLIRELWKQEPLVTLDRSLSPSDIGHSINSRVNIVSGAYLHEHGREGFNEFKRSLSHV